MIPGSDPGEGPFGPPPLGPPTGLAWGSSAGGPIGVTGRGTAASPDGKVRPWWGLGDVILAVPFIVIVSVIAAAAWAVIAALRGALDIEQFTSGVAVDLPASVIAASLVGQQIGQGAWPWIVSKWKGRGMALDWGWAFEWIDLLIGFGTAVMALVLAGVMGSVVADAVGVSTEVTNTDFLTDARGTAAFWVLVVCTAIGAPITEELLFRGLILRAIEKRAGRVVAVLGSTVAFTAPHYIAATPAELAVLLATIGSVGLVLGTVAVGTGRLAPCIVAHVVFNSFAVAQLIAG